MEHLWKYDADGCVQADKNGVTLSVNEMRELKAAVEKIAFSAHN